MKLLWAPWRIKYILSPKPDKCIFCEASSSEDYSKHYVVYKSRHSIVMLNLYPYNSGHVMVAPKRHVDSIEQLNDEELLDLVKTLKLTMKVLRETLKPEGFNVGINIGRVAGAGIEDHVHIHVVPRWCGDTNFMPVIGDVKVIPEALEDTYIKLRNAFKMTGGT